MTSRLVAEREPVAIDPHRVDSRAAMGLPARLVERLPADLFATHGELLAADPVTLVRLVADPAEPVARRLVAGQVLALVGDPRIDVFDPAIVRIPAATIRLGLADEDVDRVVADWHGVGVVRAWIEKECPRHNLDIAAFGMARYPVTNQEYRAFLADTGYETLPTGWPFGRYPEHLANHPVWTVSAEAADEYAGWLSRRTGRAFRLPSEAEWEYAASGGTAREFPWGDEFIPDRANSVEFGPLTTTPVGMYPLGRSAFGVDDMAGNVEEYVADLYRPYPGGRRVVDDLLEAGPTYRVARGGSFTRFGDLMRCRRRHGRYDRPIYVMGFRLAESL